VPLGITRGLWVESDLHGPVYFPLGLYEYEIHGWLRRLAGDGVAYDVGAASGVQALAVAKVTGQPVYAFERDPASLQSLTAHIAANPQFPIVPVEMWVGASTTGDTVALDDWVYVQGRPAPALIKIDVEGAEMVVLQGADRILRELRPNLLIETHSPELEESCIELLRSHGYTSVVIPRRRWLQEDRPSKHNQWLAAPRPGSDSGRASNKWQAVRRSLFSGGSP
jgi:hypothetical protein